MSDQHTFNPFDHELIAYLNRKITEEEDKDIKEVDLCKHEPEDIKEVDLCKHEPEDIPDMAIKKSDCQWHIITPVHKLNGRLQLTKRSCKTGNWKITGRTTFVKNVNDKTIGYKKYLVFYLNGDKSSSTRTPKIKSDWVMHEYSSCIRHSKKDAFVLCKLTKKKKAPATSEVGEESRALTDPKISPSHVGESSSVLITQDVQMVDENTFVDDLDEEFWNDLGALAEELLPGLVE
ncbi:NAC domain-containing protein 62 [Capsella rubella]|uniref:NAC domain-containing protein 62 n=1 Tax=Capsella rubella TaxID=81985 RepID=UPI000CD4C52B|nr:NAC domain-containing protein 62 [Capsella rubella]